MPSPDPRRVVVVGGVAAGMSFAARARRLDEQAEIIVLERGEHVSYANCGLPYYVGGEITDQDSLLVQTPASLRAAVNLDVRTEHDVTAIDTEAREVTVDTKNGTITLPYDELVLAPGAATVLPDIPGISGPGVQALRTVEDAVQLRHVADSAKRAVVLGAGFIGVEAAEALRLRGLEVHLVQSSAHVLSPLEQELASIVTAELEHTGVSVHARTTATAIMERGDEVEVSLADGESLIADTVVVAIGVRPDARLAMDAGIQCELGAIVTDAHGRTSAPNVWAAGDAVIHRDPVTGLPRLVPLAGPANRDGRLIADAMFEPVTGIRARAMPLPLGTAVVRVFGLTAAMTGANRRALDAARIGYETIHLHPGDHAGYFPGATPIHLVVHFASADGHRPGAILGAQAVGRNGVDKRIDVLATAIRAGMTVADLIDLDLAYAPPYGSAKDPITMAGLLGQNVLDGITTLWQPWELAEVQRSALILDVRSEDEYAAGHLPGALNIAHTELRDRIDEVREAAAGRPVRTHCASGVRSYLAHRLLVAEGFDSATLSGGMRTLLAFHGKDILSNEIHQRATTA